MDLLGVVAAIIVIGFRLWRMVQRQERWEQVQRNQDYAVQMAAKRAAAAEQKKIAAARLAAQNAELEIGFSTGAKTADGKFFTGTGAVTLDVIKYTPAGSMTTLWTSPKAKQTHIALQLVTNFLSEYIGTLASSQITDDTAGFLKNLENALRDHLHGEGFTLKALRMFQHNLE